MASVRESRVDHHRLVCQRNQLARRCVGSIAAEPRPALLCKHRAANLLLPAVLCSLLCCVVQEGGRALVNLLFGAQSPSGRLPITWYSSSYTAAVSPLNLNMRPGAATGHPGRSYRCGRACVCMQYLGNKLCARGMSMEHV